MKTEVKTNIVDVIKARFGGLSNYTSHIIKYSLFIISAIYTILLFRSQGATEFSKILQSVLGAILELAKFTLPTVAIVGVISGKSVNWGLRIVALLLALACFYYSIKATEGFQLIELQEINRANIESSDDYIRLKKQLDSKEAQLKTANDNSSKLIDLDRSNKNDNTRLINQLNSDNTSLQKQKASKNNELQTAINKKQYNTQTRLKLEIKQIQSSIDNNYMQLKGLKTDDILTTNNNNINSLNNDISALNKQIDALKVNSKSKSGYDILFSNTKEFNDFIYRLAILIELIGIFFSVMVGLQAKNKKVRKITTVFYDDAESLSNTTIQDKKEAKNNDDDSNIFGFKFNEALENKSNLDKDTIDRYKGYMLKNAVKSSDDKLISRGHKHISENIGIDNELGRKIKGYLEQIGIVKTIGNKTYIQAHSQAHTVKTL